MVTRCIVAWVGLLALAFSGCSGGMASATGSVKFDGKLVKSGTLVFYDAQGVGTPASIEADGTYKVTGVPSGIYKVGLSSPDPRMNQTVAGINSRAKGKTDSPKAAPTDTEKAWFAVPEKASKPESSGVTVVLNPGENKADLTFNP
jgi:hypothetical protein